MMFRRATAGPFKRQYSNILNSAESNLRSLIVPGLSKHDESTDDLVLISTELVLRARIALVILPALFAHRADEFILTSLSPVFVAKSTFGNTALFRKRS